MFKKITILTLLFALIFPFFAQAEELGQRLAGKILLQVESKGEAWYINPDNDQRYYLGRPADAFKIMRDLGLGISNKDFDAWEGTAPSRLAGKIVLKVEDLGKAYYINPDDLKMYYLQRPMNAFDLMKQQGLGITNASLNLINVTKGYGYYDPAPLITGESEEPANEEEINNEKESFREEAATSTEETATSTTETATSTEETATSTKDDCIFYTEYYNNKSLFGAPIATATYDMIDFDWGRNAPDAVDLKDKFSARFTASCYFEAGEYKFTATVDDGIKAYFDDVNFIQTWQDRSSARTIIRNRNIDAGTHEIRLDYYEDRNDANLYFNWELIE